MQSKKDKMSSDLADILSGSIHRYISFIADFHKIRPTYKSKGGTMHYGFVPMGTNPILDILYELYNHMGGHKYKHSFLDIGCGIGNIVLLANEIGFDAYGLEYNSKIYNIAKRIISSHHIFKGNMTSFKDYGKYDILYYYLPMADGEAMTKFATKLAKAVKPGAYIIPDGVEYVFNESEEFENIRLTSNGYRSVYRKKGK